MTRKSSLTDDVMLNTHSSPSFPHWIFFICNNALLYLPILYRFLYYRTFNYLIIYSLLGRNIQALKIMDRKPVHRCHILKTYNLLLLLLLRKLYSLLFSGNVSIVIFKLNSNRVTWGTNLNLDNLPSPSTLEQLKSNSFQT